MDSRWYTLKHKLANGAVRCYYKYMHLELFTELPSELAVDIALSKSWHGNLAVLDLIDESDRTIRTLDAYPYELSDDLTVVRSTSELILGGEKDIPVGEGGAWARKLAYASATYGWGLRLQKSGSLAGRPDEFTVKHVGAPLSVLGSLNNRSSQLQSAAVLCDNDEPTPANASYHLRMAYEARKYHALRAGADIWEHRTDETLQRHGLAWLNWLISGVMALEPVQAEDYAQMRVFGTITPNQARTLGWFSLAGHESNRFVEVDEAIHEAQTGQVVKIDDHRPLMALRWKYGPDVRLARPQAISKSWPLPQFNRFTNRCVSLAAV